MVHRYFTTSGVALLAYACPSEEEPLFGSESVNSCQSMALHVVLEGSECDIQAAIIADILTEGLLTVDFHPGRTSKLEK